MMNRSTWHVKSIDSSSVTRPCMTEMHLSRDTNNGVSASSHRLSLPFARAPLAPAPPSDFIIRCSISPSVRRRLITSFRCCKHIVPDRHQPSFNAHRNLSSHTSFSHNTSDFYKYRSRDFSSPFPHSATESTTSKTVIR